MRLFSLALTFAALVCTATPARAEEPAPTAPAATPPRKGPEGVIELGLFATAAVAGGVAATVAAANTRDDEPDSPRDLYVMLAGWGYLAGGATTAVTAYILMDHLQRNRSARAAVTVVPRAGPTGAGASILGRF